MQWLQVGTGRNIFDWAPGPNGIELHVYNKSYWHVDDCPQPPGSRREVITVEDQICVRQRLCKTYSHTVLTASFKQSYCVDIIIRLILHMGKTEG